MTRDVVTARIEADLRSVARIMATQRLKRLPVVDTDRRVVGIVSRVDILRTLTEQYPAEGADEPVVVALGASTVGAVMSRHVPSVTEDAPLPEILDAIVSTRLNRAVVVNSERRPIGVVTDAELMRRIGPGHHSSLGQSLMLRLPFVHHSPEELEQTHAEHGNRAADLMLAPVITVREATPIAEAAQRMLERRYKILPVVDDDGRLAGLVDRADLLRAMAAE